MFMDVKVSSQWGVTLILSCQRSAEVDQQSKSHILLAKVKAGSKEVWLTSTFDLAPRNTAAFLLATSRGIFYARSPPNSSWQEFTADAYAWQM